MSRVALRPAARRDIHRHADYIGEKRRSAGRRFYSAAERALKKLAENPNMGSLCEWENPALVGIRVWSIKGFKYYLIFYMPLTDGIDVIRVLHGSMDLERILGDALNPGGDGG
jgi:toxin ParE1/3/4